MKSRLDIIEARLQTFIEGTLASLLPWGNTQRALARQLVNEMQQQLQTRSDGQLIAPNLYRILINPSRFAYWEAQPAYLEELSDILEQAGQEAGIRFLTPPLIQVVADGSLSNEGIQIAALYDEASISQTAALESSPIERSSGLSEIPSSGFLIVNGVDIYPLEKAVINIGRRQDNHLVIEDPRVSRSHAQLRAVKGQFVLFDLNSTSGTFVNGKRVTRHTLMPGDVISIAGVPLIFGLDTEPDGSDEGSSTRPIQPEEDKGKGNPDQNMDPDRKSSHDW